MIMNLNINKNTKCIGPDVDEFYNGGLYGNVIVFVLPFGGLDSLI